MLRKENKMYDTIYTVSKVTKNDKCSGPIHAAHDDTITVCGQKIDHTWYIVTNAFDGTVTCKKCLKILTGPKEEFIKNMTNC